MKGWKDITLRQAQEILNLGEMDDELDLVISQMAIIRDTTNDEIERLPTVELAKFAQEYSFLNELPKEKLTRTFKHRGVRYGITPLGELSLAQVVDIEEYYSQGFNQNIHKILSCLYSPVKRYNPLTGKYKTTPYKPDPEIENMFLDMDMQFVWENILFFYHIEQIYLRGLKGYLDGTLKMTEKKK